MEWNEQFAESAAPSLSEVEKAHLAAGIRNLIDPGSGFDIAAMLSAPAAPTAPVQPTIDDLRAWALDASLEPGQRIEFLVAVVGHQQQQIDGLSALIGGGGPADADRLAKVRSIGQITDLLTHITDVLANVVNAIEDIDANSSSNRNGRRDGNVIHATAVDLRAELDDIRESLGHS